MKWKRYIFHEWRSHQWNMNFHFTRWNKSHIYDKYLNILYITSFLHSKKRLRFRLFLGGWGGGGKRGGGLQSDFCKNLTEFYQISRKKLPYLTDFSPQLMTCMTAMKYSKINWKKKKININWAAAGHSSCGQWRLYQTGWMVTVYKFKNKLKVGLIFLISSEKLSYMYVINVLDIA